MSLSVVCGQCSTRLRVPEKVSGKRVKCPKCSASILVPVAEEIALDEVQVVEEPRRPNLDETNAGDGDFDNFGDFLSNLDSSDAGAFEASKFASELESATFGLQVAAFQAGPTSGPVAVAAEQPIYDASDAARRRNGVPTHFLVAGVGGTVLVIMLAGLGLWFFVSDSSPPSNPVVSQPEGSVAVAVEPGSKESTETPSEQSRVGESPTEVMDMPWAVAESNRAKRLGYDAVETVPKPIEPAASVAPVVKSVSQEASTIAKVATPANALSLEQVIDQIKANTVFIKVKTREGEQTGSGFLVDVDERLGYIVTNSHVVTADKGVPISIQCVLHSGTLQQVTLVAHIRSRDADNDLAVLGVTNNQKLPDIVNWTNATDVRETSTVLAAGFPFGEILSTNKRFPSITISKGSVSSIRRDDFDQIALLQVDGGIHPGNSGGPVLTQNGELIGVAVAKVRNTSIGFAIPRRVLQELLYGRIASIHVQQNFRADGERQLEMKMKFLDPTQKIRDVEVLLFSAKNQKVTKPGSNGQWDQVAEELVEKKNVTYLLKHSQAQASFNTSLPNLVCQVAWTAGDGTRKFSEPVKVKELDQQSSGESVATTSLGPSVLPKVEPDIQGTGMVLLPNEMSDFAINANNGDVACVDPVSHRAFLVKANQLSGGADLKELPSVLVGTTPVGITYKLFGDKEYYTVVCSQDSHVYAIDAKSFELTKKIPIQGAGVSHVTCSSNPADPFVYYNYGSGHDSEAGVIDLRVMRDRGKAFDDSMDCAISADGKFAYRRGPWSPSGFESLRLANDFTADTPEFKRSFYDHRSCTGYVPGPFGQFVAVGSKIHTVGLEKHYASLPFAPSCFFTSQPVAIGFAPMVQNNTSKPTSLRLFAASYNNFQTTGNAIQLPKELVGTPLTLPRGVAGRADFKQVGSKTRLLPDEIHKRVIYATNDKIVTIPLTAFGIAKEPFMRLEKRKSTAKIGSANTFSIEATDPDVKIQLGDLPHGAELVAAESTSNKATLKWSPTEDQVGSHEVPVTLSFKEIQRVLNFTFEVEQPSIQAPLEVAGFRISPTESFCVAWSGPPVDRYGRTHIRNPEQPVMYDLCVIPFRRGVDPIKVSIPWSIKEVIIAGARLAILPSNNNQQVPIYDLRTLEREKLLLPTSPLQTIRLDGNELHLEGTQSDDVYSIKTLRLIRSTGPETPTPQRHGRYAQNQTVFLDGLFEGGVLKDVRTGTVKLIVSPGRIPSLPGANSQLLQGQFLRQQTDSPSTNPTRPGGSASIVAGPTAVAETNQQVSLENRVSNVNVPGSVHTRRLTQQVTLLVIDGDNALSRRVPIFRGVRLDTQNAPRPHMQVSDGKVWVACGDRVYRWIPPNLGTDGSLGSSDPIKLHFKPSQSTLVSVRQKETLNHELAGGTAPFDYFLMTRLDGISMDEKTGNVTIDRSLLIQSPQLRQFYASRSPTSAADISHQLKSKSIDMMGEFKRLTNRKPQGFPVAVPIHIKASDREGGVAELQYFVLVDFPIADLVRQATLGAPSE